MPRPLAIVLFCCLAGILATPAHGRQMPALSPLCAGGGPEAEALYQEALRVWLRPKGLTYDQSRYKAEKLFNEAMKKGSVLAALGIADMYRRVYDRYSTDQARSMNALYEWAIEAGCPDGYLGLAQNHAEGWAVPKSEAKALDLLKTGAERGSPKCMERYGECLLENKQTASGTQWLRRSIEAGNGEAALPLAEMFRRAKNATGLIRALRDGARQGSKECLMRLTLTYQNGLYGQQMDMDEADCYRALYHAIPDLARPGPIAGFDALCPMKPVRPFTP